MRSGTRWLLAGMAGTVLALPNVSLAQQRPPAARPNARPGSPLAPSGDAAAPARPAAGSSLPANQQGSFMPPPPIRPGQPVTVLVFPFGFTGVAGDAAPAAGAGGPGAAAGATDAAPAPGLTPAQLEASNYLTGIVKAGFLATPAYTVATYYPQSSLVQRARKDDILKEAQLLDVTDPGTGAVNVDKARVVTNRLGIQALLVGNMDVKTDTKANSVEVTLDTQLINSSTGEVIRQAAVSGAAAGAEGVALTTVQERASLEAAQKLLPAMGIQLVAPRPAAAPAAPSKSKSRGKTTQKAQPKADAGKTDKAERKKAEEARKQEQQAAEQARKEQEHAAAQAREAEKEAKRAAEKAKREADRQAAAERRTQEKRVASAEVKHAAAKPAAAAEAAEPAHPATVPVVQTAPAAPQQAPTVAPAPASSPVPGSVEARTNEAGQPVPYGYAVSQNIDKLPSRNRAGIKVPAWLGVAGFLAGLSFLL